MAGSRLTDLTPAVVGDLDNDSLLYIVTDPAVAPADKSLALSVLRDRLATDLSDDFATAAQGALAETAVQPGALAAVATSGDYGDLSGTPTLGTAAAADTGDFATAAQGAKADTAVQHVRWSGSAWPARPPDAEFVIFVSTHDPAAVAPTDINLAQGDYWLRAPGV